MRDVLHRLPIRQHMQFKLCVLVFNSLHNLAPNYLSTMCQLRTLLAGVPANLIRRLQSVQNAAARLIWSLESAVQNTLRTHSPVFTGSVFQSASCSKSRYLATEQRTAVRPRTCRPTSPASLMCHLDWDSDHLTLTKWLCHPSTSLPSAGGPSQFLPLICGIASRHTSPHHRRSRFSGCVSRLFFFSVLILIIWHLIVDLAVTLLFRPH